LITLAIRPISSFLSTRGRRTTLSLSPSVLGPHSSPSFISRQSAISISHQPSASATICSSTPNEGLFSHCRASSAHSSPPHVFIVVLRCSPIPSMHKECCASAVLTPFISFCVAAKIPNSDYSALSSLPCDPPFEPSPLLGLPILSLGASQDGRRRFNGRIDY